MFVLQGRSFEKDAEKAVAEATHGWTHTPEFLFIFSSTQQNPEAIAQILGTQFPNVPMAGSTSAGEHLNGEHATGSLVISGLCETGIRWQTALIKDLIHFDEPSAEQLANSLFEGLEIDLQTMSPDDHFCLLFIDGLSVKEEEVTALLADAIGGIALAGGSAGDDLAFKETKVYYEGHAYTNAASVVMGTKENAEVNIIKHQHFVTTSKDLVITKADLPTRTVYEIDGYPALQAYAAALGLQPEEMTDDISFLHPITFCCNDELYVRSIQKINADQSLTFYCGIEEGMVLNIGGHNDMKESLQKDLLPQTAALEKPDFMLGFNCILRALEANAGDTHKRLGKVIQNIAHSMTGFDTYGEQLNGLHINQTLLAVTFRGTAQGN